MVIQCERSDFVHKLFAHNTSVKYLLRRLTFKNIQNSSYTIVIYQKEASVAADRIIYFYFKPRVACNKLTFSSRLFTLSFDDLELQNRVVE